MQAPGADSGEHPQPAQAATKIQSRPIPGPFHEHTQTTPHDGCHRRRHTLPGFPSPARRHAQSHRRVNPPKNRMLRIKQLPTFDSVAAGKKAVVDLPLGLRYHAIWLELGNNATAANAITDLVEDIVVKINGKPKRTHSGFQLNVINGINDYSYLLNDSGTTCQIHRRLYLTC